MKKSITTIALLSFTMAGMAQTNTPVPVVPVKPEVKQSVKVPEKPIYLGIPNTKMVSVTITVPAYLLGDFSVVAQSGEDAINNSPQISALQATMYKKNYHAAIDSLNSKWNAYIAADQARWAADTGKVKSITKKQ